MSGDRNAAGFDKTMNGFPWVAVPFGEERPAIEAAVPCTGLCVCLCLCVCVRARACARRESEHRWCVGRNASGSRLGGVTCAVPARSSSSVRVAALCSPSFNLYTPLSLSSPVEGAAQCCVLHAKDELAARLMTQ